MRVRVLVRKDTQQAMCSPQRQVMWLHPSLLTTIALHSRVPAVAYPLLVCSSWTARASQLAAVYIIKSDEQYHLLKYGLCMTLWLGRTEILHHKSGPY